MEKEFIRRFGVKLCPTAYSCFSSANISDEERAAIRRYEEEQEEKRRGLLPIRLEVRKKYPERWGRRRGR